MRGEKNLFSIIIPVYNVEKYLDKCLIIDDGSPDNSNAIIDEYVKLDQRFMEI